MPKPIITPEVKVNVALTPANDSASILTYKKLETEVEKQEPYISDRWEQFNDAEVGSIEEYSGAMKLAQQFMLQTALKGLEADSPAARELWEQRFTDANIELFGSPDANVVHHLAAEELSNIRELIGVRGVEQKALYKVIGVYERIVGNIEITGGESLAEVDPETGAEINDYLEERFGEVLELTDKLEDRPHTSEELVGVFDKALIALKSINHVWERWNVVLADQSGLSIDNEKLEIRIGSRRNPAWPAEIKKLLAHELLIHAQRTTNGIAQGKKEFEKPIDGYSEFEEGFGIISEEAVSGEFPYRAKNRYIDISLALGQNGVRLGRQELFDFAYNREIIRQQIEGESDSKADIETQVWAHLGRIFRGGDGTNESMTVFTRYIYYYNGYMKAARYIKEQKNQGKTTTEIMDYLLQAKFDPTNEAHARLIDQKGKKI